MDLEALLNTIPAYAKDLKLNLSSVLRQAELSEQQTWGTAVACAIAARSDVLSSALSAEAAKHLSPEALDAAKAAAAVMGMNNVFYRFTHTVGDGAYQTMPARLRMQVIRSHGSDPVDFELWCLAVSSINNCVACMGSHERVVREKGISTEVVTAAIRIAAVVHALAPVLEFEAAAGAGPAR